MIALTLDETPFPKLEAEAAQGPGGIGEEQVLKDQVSHEVGEVGPKESPARHFEEPAQYPQFSVAKFCVCDCVLFVSSFQ